MHRQHELELDDTELKLLSRVYSSGMLKERPEISKAWARHLQQRGLIGGRAGRYSITFKGMDALDTFDAQDRMDAWTIWWVKPAEARFRGDELGVDWSVVAPDELALGMTLEGERLSLDDWLDELEREGPSVTRREAEELWERRLAELALENLEEQPGYYTRLIDVDEEAAKYWRWIRRPARRNPRRDLPRPGSVSRADAKRLGDELEVDWNEVALDQFTVGVNVELEHADVVGSDILAVARIALDHLEERGDYYSRLIAVEPEVAGLWKSVWSQHSNRRGRHSRRLP